MSKKTDAIVEKVNALIKAFSSKATPCKRIGLANCEHDALTHDRKDIYGCPVDPNIPLIYRGVTLYRIN